MVMEKDIGIGINMPWERRYLLGGAIGFENSVTGELIAVTYRNNMWLVTVNLKPISSSPNELGAKEIVKQYMKENP